MFSGSMVALVTPMKLSGEIDFEALSRLIEMQIECGTTAIVLLGTTGEAATIEPEEQQRIISHAVKQIAGRVPVIVGVSANSMPQAIHKLQVAMQEGADAALVLSPAYIRPTQEGVYHYFKNLADSVAIPQIIYNVPARTACDVLPETLQRLANIPNIIGVKEASGDLFRAQEILRLCEDKIDVYSGNDSDTLPMILVGGKGVISVTANIAPKLMSQMCQAALAGEQKLARSLNDKLLLLHKRLFIETNPIPVKWCLQELGLIPAGIRLPMTPLSKQYHPALREALQAAE